jgi:hypothetical protein
MKDFDAEREERLAVRAARFEGRDRSFKLGGEVFEFRLFVAFSVIEATFSVDDDTAPSLLSDRLNKALPQLIEPGENDEALARLETIKEKVELADFQNAVFWILEQFVQRPTSAPSSSGDGRESTGTNSTETSFSEVAEPVASAH